MTQHHWSDDRLTAAFVERYDRPAPHELITATLEQVRATARRSGQWRVLDRPALVRVATAAVGVAILAAILLPRTEPGPTASSPTILHPSTAPTPRASAPSASSEPSPVVEGFAATVAGLKVRSVAEATRLFADPVIGDTEVAVAGWYWARSWNLRCPAGIPGESPLIDRCGAFKAWLGAGPDPLLKPDGELIDDRTHGPTIEPRFLWMSDAPLRLESVVEDPWTTIDPHPLILIGHIHDERSSRCPSWAAAACEGTFVVDQFASADGVLPTPPLLKPIRATRLEADRALQMAQGWVAGFGTVLRVDLQFNSDAPWFSSKTTGCVCPATWFIRGYRTLPNGTTDPRGAGTPVAGWLAIDDATGAISGTLDEGLQDQHER
jgi:hypothetical protein